MRYSYVTPAVAPENPRPGRVIEPWAAPEVPARVVALGDPEVPLGARRLAAAATRAGWTVVATYARGTDPGKRVPCIVDSLALRMRREGRRAVAVWHDGRFESAWLFGDRPPVRRNATGLRKDVAS